MGTPVREIFETTIEPVATSSRRSPGKPAGYGRRGLDEIVSLALLAGAIVLGLVAGDGTLSIALAVLYTALLTLGLNLVTGFTGQLDFGHAAFFGIGAYVAAKIMIERPELDFALVCALSAAAALIAALLVGCTVFRLQGHFLALATLGVGEIVHTLATNMEWTGGANGLPGIPVAVFLGVELNTIGELYWLGLVLVGAAWAIATFLTRRRPGRAMMAIRDDELAARSSGITPFWWKQFAFGTAAGMAGVAGAYFAAVFAFVGPDSFNLETSILLVEMVLLGGLGSHAGSLLGATVFVAGQTLLVTNVPSLGGRQALVIGVAVLLFIVLRPQGIMGRPFVRRRS